MVGLQTLNLPILVRAQASEPCTMRCMAEPCVRVSRFPARNLHYGFRYALGENVKLHLLPEMEFCYSSIYICTTPMFF